MPLVIVFVKLVPDYDFKGSNTTIERSEKQLTVVTDDDLKLRQVHDLIITHFVRRKVDTLCLKD